MTDKIIDPDMPADQLRLHMGELTPREMNVARAAIRWVNSTSKDPQELVNALKCAPLPRETTVEEYEEWFEDVRDNALAKREGKCPIKPCQS
jgi:hypothetical protein